MNQPSFFASCLFVVLEMWVAVLGFHRKLIPRESFFLFASIRVHRALFFLTLILILKLLQVSLLRRIVTPTIRVHYSVLNTDV